MRFRRLGRVVPRQSLGKGPRAHPEPRHQRRIAGDLEHPVGQGGNVAMRHEKPRLAEDVNAMRGETRGVPREHEPGARCLRRRNLAIEPEIPGQGLELQGIALALEQVANFRETHRGSRARARRLALARRRLGDLSSWRRTLATAASSAVR